MKRLALLFYVLMIVSCNNNQSGKEGVVQPQPIATVAKPDSSHLIKDSHYFWSAELDQKGKLVMKKDSPISADSLTPGLIIMKLNNAFPENQLEFVKISSDSIFVKIRNSSFLTQQMGSSGAEGYLGAVTYNLSELKNINYINIKFKEGDHASPGTYSRIDFLHEGK